MISCCQTFDWVSTHMTFNFYFFKSTLIIFFKNKTKVENPTLPYKVSYNVETNTAHEILWAVRIKQCAKRGFNNHLHATWQAPASEIRTPKAPDLVVREGHPVIVTFTHKQWVLHLLTRPVIIWKRPSTAHKHTQEELEFGSANSRGTESSDRTIGDCTCICSSLCLVKLGRKACVTMETWCEPKKGAAFKTSCADSGFIYNNYQHLLVNLILYKGSSCKETCN